MVSMPIPLMGRDRKPRAFAWVSWQDYAAVRKWKWYLGTDGYAYRNRRDFEGVGRGHVAMHRELLGLTDGKIEADHRNRVKLDNRRPNLVVCVSFQNKQNIPVKGLSKYRGVSFHKQSQKWRARCQVNGKVHSLGYFKSEDEAGAASIAFHREHQPYARDLVAMPSPDEQAA